MSLRERFRQHRERGAAYHLRRGGFTGKKMILLMATKTREADGDGDCPMVDANREERRKENQGGLSFCAAVLKSV